MTLIDIQWHPCDRQLRQFAVATMVACPLLAYWWFGGDRTILTWTAAIAATIGVVGLAFPRVLSPLFVGLSLITFPIGMVVGELAMVMVYGLVFVPMAFIFGLMGRDTLRRRQEKKREATYWVAKRQAKSAQSYYQQW